MTEKRKQLLLNDLCGRLPYAVRVKVIYRAECPYEDDIEGIFFLNEIDTRLTENLYWIGGNQLQECGIGRGISSFATCSDDEDEVVKPYLFPLSSMTEEQYDKFTNMGYSVTENYFSMANYHMIDWFNKHHFDYRGLIEQGLAIDATGLGIYNKEE